MQPHSRITARWCCTASGCYESARRATLPPPPLPPPCSLVFDAKGLFLLLLAGVCGWMFGSRDCLRPSVREYLPVLGNLMIITCARRCTFTSRNPITPTAWHQDFHLSASCINKRSSTAVITHIYIYFHIYTCIYNPLYICIFIYTCTHMCMCVIHMIMYA